jgi:hypothetical protein
MTDHSVYVLAGPEMAGDGLATAVCCVSMVNLSAPADDSFR